MSDPRLAVVYGEAVRTLDQQQAAVESLRGRAGILLSASAVATSFLAGLALDTGKGLTGWSAWMATASFLAVGGFCLAILWPTRKWTFRANSKKLIRDYIDTDPSSTLAEIHRDLAIHMENWAAINSWKMRWLFLYFQAASLLLGVEVFLSIIDLWRR